MRIKFYSVCFIVCILFSTRCLSQTYGNSILTEKPNTPINEMINGYIEVLPLHYAENPTKKYPLLIFLEGQSQLGNGSSELQLLYGTNNGMLPDLVKKGSFPNSYTVDGSTYEFIVITPQVRWQVKSGRPSAEQMASPTEVNDIINFALQNYRVDVGRVYLAGLSLGGGSIWNYAGQNIDNANRIAAIVPFAGASCLCDNHSRDDNIAAAHLPVWTFVTNVDTVYRLIAQEYVDSINLIPTHSPDALITIYERGAHDHNSWGVPLSGGSTQPPAGQPDNIYQWMLQYKRESLTQPVFANVNAGPDQMLQLVNGSMMTNAHGISFNNANVTLSGSASAGAGGRPIVSRRWVKVDGTGGTITSPTSLTTTVTNLKPGFYTYQLRVTDDQGLISVDNVKITVVAPPENKYKKVEAEDHTSYSGLPANHVDRTTFDEGPAYVVGWLALGSWVEYTIPSLPEGMYSLYYRYNSSSGNPAIDVISGGTTYTRTLVSDRTWRSDSIKQIYLGANATIRFQSKGNSWAFDYFELAQISAQSPLPVKFVYFNAKCEGSSVVLQWKTGQEQNSSDFSVERSKDGTSWNEIGRVAAAGQSTQERSYVFVDKSPASSSGLYRIVEHDLTGQTTLSSIIRSSCSSSANAISLYPNPNAGNGSLNITLQQSTKVTLQVIDSKGAQVQQKQLLLPSGTTILPLEMKSYPKGIYSIKVNYNNEEKIIKMIKN